MGEAVEQVAARILPLDATHRRAGAVVVERDGWLLPANYGAAGAEYDAVRGGGGAGLFDLSARGRVEVGGKEAVQFLNGLVTNDVKALAPGSWMPAAFPNPQGRLVAFARVAREGDGEVFYIDTEPATSARVFHSLERFTLAGDFKVKDLTEETVQLSVQGARASAIIRAVLGDAAASTERGQVSPARRAAAHLTVMRATHTAEDGFDLIVGAIEAAPLWDALVAAGARPAGQDALEVLRIEAGLPRHGADVDESNVVSEAGQDEAVSFTKGCYVGQEIIARIRWRGHVAKRLAGLLPEGDGALEPGAKVRTADGAREAGRVTSVAHSPRLGRQIALGVVKYDFLAPGTEVLIGEDCARRATVAELPLVRGGWHDAGGGEAA